MKFGGRIGAVLEKIFLRLGTRHVAVSRMTYKLLHEAGVPTHQLQLAENVVLEVGGAVTAGAPDLVFVGRLVEHKNPMFAVEALSKLPGNSVRLGIVGKGELKNDLVSLAQRYGLGSRVSFLSDLTDDELGTVLRSASVVLSPSEREGFGLVVAEALSVGTPVVTVDAPTNAAKEFIISVSVGRVCRTGDIDDFVDGVAEILASPPPREGVMAEFASLNIPKSYAEVARKYAAVYQECRDRRRDQ
jgi:glycosyltransferase involved in cell wall biosynthesis